jgi:hypothetical protein
MIPSSSERKVKFRKMAVQLTVQVATAPPPPDLADLGGLTPLQGFGPRPMILELYFNP